MTTYVDDIEFIFSEITRYAKIDPKELIKHESPMDLLTAVLPHPSGSGKMIIGGNAAKRLRKLAELALSRSQHKGFIEASAVQEKLKVILVNRFLKEARSLNTKEASRAISAAIKQAATKRNDRTHYIPCHLSHQKSPKEFSIGPVSFLQWERVFAKLESSLQAFRDGTSIKKNDTNISNVRSQYSEKLLFDAQNYYSSFEWVAEILVKGCDPAISRRQANRIVQYALDCLHLLLGAAYSNHMRAGGPGFATDSRGHIELNQENDIELSVSSHWKSHNLGEGWWEWINRNDGDYLVDLMGVAVAKGSNVQQQYELSQRFLDGAAWYGEAVRDEFVASRIVKFVTAIERILVTKNEENLTEVLASRGAAMILDPGQDDFKLLQKRFRNIYNLRSRLIHGSRSPLDTAIGSSLGEADHLAQSVLLRSLQFFRREGLELRTVNTSKLDQAFDDLIHWAKLNSKSSS